MLTFREYISATESSFVDNTIVHMIPYKEGILVATKSNIFYCKEKTMEVCRFEAKAR